MSKTIVIFLLAFFLLAPFSSTLAYIGPGAGISVLGSMLGILATILVAIGAIIAWPLRKFSQRRKQRRNPSTDNNVEKTRDKTTTG